MLTLFKSYGSYGKYNLPATYAGYGTYRRDAAPEPDAAPDAAAEAEAEAEKRATYNTYGKYGK